jgi:hypothetical protein
MKQWYIEVAIFALAVVGAFSFAWYLAQTVGLNPLIVHEVGDRQKYWTVAVGCAAFVAIFDAVLLSLIVRKHRRQRQAAEAAGGPRLG